jgi:hypothetical protein
VEPDEAINGVPVDVLGLLVGQAAAGCPVEGADVEGARTVLAQPLSGTRGMA